MLDKRRLLLSLTTAALLYGSLWGMAEATAGHVLHLARLPGVAGLVMFPIGFFLASRAYRRSGHILAVMMASWIAAGIKLSDLLLPGADLMAVWNPAQAILLEGLAAAGLLLVMKKTRTMAAWPALASLGWRMVYIALSLLWAYLFGARNLIQLKPAFSLRFLLLDSLVNGSLIYFLVRMRPLRAPVSVLNRNVSRLLSWPDDTKAKAAGQPALAIALLIAALSLELVL